MPTVRTSPSPVPNLQPHPQPIQLFCTEGEPDAPASFAKGFQGGMVLLPCEIHTLRVRQFYRRNFEQLSHWLSGLDRVRNFRDVDPRQVDAADAAIAACLKDAHARCAHASQQANTLLEAGGLADIAIHYAAPATVAVPIIHPHARTCLEVLLAADGAFATIERLWLLGQIDTRERRSREAVLRQALRSVAGEVRQQYGAMARVVRGDRPRAPAPVRPLHTGDAGDPGPQTVLPPATPHGG